MKAIYDPKTTSIGEPEYHKNNRGRPSLKNTTQKTKKLHLLTQDPPKMSSGVESELFDLNKEPARHSMYDNQTPYSNESYYQDPFISKTQTHNPDPYIYSTQPWETPPFYVDPNMNNPNFLIGQGLELFLPYITQVQDVRADGNCGFRATAVCLGQHQDIWRQIRMDLLHELAVHNATYTSIFNEQGVQSLQYILNHFEGRFAPEEHWMFMPDTGLLIASRYNVVVIFLSKDGETTCLPLFTSPPNSQPHHICAIARFYGNHFVRLDLQGDFPIPPVHPQWATHAFDRTWENSYSHRQKLYDQLKFPNRNSRCVETYILDD